MPCATGGPVRTQTTAAFRRGCAGAPPQVVFRIDVDRPDTSVRYRRGQIDKRTGDGETQGCSPFYAVAAPAGAISTRANGRFRARRHDARIIKSAADQAVDCAASPRDGGCGFGRKPSWPLRQRRSVVPAGTKQVWHHRSSSGEDMSAHSNLRAHLSITDFPSELCANHHATGPPRTTRQAQHFPLRSLKMIRPRSSADGSEFTNRRLLPGRDYFRVTRPMFMSSVSRLPPEFMAVWCDSVTP